MRKCEYCGAFLDAGEECGCAAGTDIIKKPTKRMMTKYELKRMVSEMSHAQYTAYLRSLAQ